MRDLFLYDVTLAEAPEELYNRLRSLSELVAGPKPEPPDDGPDPLETIAQQLNDRMTALEARTQT